MKCEGVKADGSPCGAMALVGGRYCMMHDPEAQDRADAARRKGGQVKRAARRLGAAHVAGIEDLLPVLSVLIDDLLENGEIGAIARARTVATLAATYAGIASGADLARRVARLEAERNGEHREAD